jgi:hypothetical protein
MKTMNLILNLMGKLLFRAYVCMRMDVHCVRVLECLGALSLVPSSNNRIFTTHTILHHKRTSTALHSHCLCPHPTT